MCAVIVAALTVAASTFEGNGAYIGNAVEKYCPEVSQVTNLSEIVVKAQSYYSTCSPYSTGEDDSVLAQNDSLYKTEKGYSVYVNDEILGNVSEKGKVNLEKHIEEFLSSYKSDEKNAKTVLTDKIEYARGTFDSLSIVSSQEILAQMELEAKTTYKTTCSEEIPFEVVYENSDQIFTDCRVVSTEGKAGQKNVVYTVSEINGEVVSKTAEKETVVADAVNQVVLVGTKQPVTLSAEDIEKAGDYVFPLSGQSCYISSDFGYREFDGSFHNGTDYAADEGTEVYCAADGVVTFAGWDDTGYGNYVVVTHENGYKTGYAHLSSIYAEEGKKISAGDIIGGVGSTGYSTGNHLHLNVFYNGESVDPQELFG